MAYGFLLGFSTVIVHENRGFYKYFIKSEVDDIDFLKVQLYNKKLLGVAKNTMAL